jgi:hypothetical protein
MALNQFGFFGNFDDLTVKHSRTPAVLAADACSVKLTGCEQCAYVIIAMCALAQVLLLRQ